MVRFLKFDIALVLLVSLSFAVVAIQGGGRQASDEQAFLELASPTVAAVPSQLGAWRSTQESPLTERTLAILKCDEHVNRYYVDDSSGRQVVVTVLLGPAGPLVSHSPEVCLSSAHYELISPSKIFTLTTANGKSLDVQRATFRSKDIAREVLRVYYAWVRPDGSWVAPSNPRWELGGDVGLWKIQVSTVLSAEQAMDASGESGGERGVVSVVDSEVDAAEQFLVDNGESLRDLFQNP